MNRSSRKTKSVASDRLYDRFCSKRTQASGKETKRDIFGYVEIRVAEVDLGDSLGEKGKGEALFRVIQSLRRKSGLD